MTYDINITQEIPGFGIFSISMRKQIDDKSDVLILANELMQLPVQEDRKFTLEFEPVRFKECPQCRAEHTGYKDLCWDCDPYAGELSVEFKNGGEDA